ncbi:UNVERIFIED_CONTAM: hypothetical protein HHA_235560 [Hammondia hammondi]|eukprot:XP_008885543.1 hypothetical protein HHA_235560 [Hammondia hammondi]
MTRKLRIPCRLMHNPFFTLLHTSAMGPADLLNATTVASTLYPLRPYDVSQSSLRFLPADSSNVSLPFSRFPKQCPLFSGASLKSTAVPIDAAEPNLKTSFFDSKKAQSLAPGFPQCKDAGETPSRRLEAAEDNSHKNGGERYASPRPHLSRDVLWERLVSRASVLLPNFSPSGIVQLLFLLHRAGCKPRALLDQIATQLLEQEACAAPPESFWSVWTANDIVLFLHVLGLHHYRHEPLLGQVVKELKKATFFLTVSDLGILFGACSRLLALPKDGGESALFFSENDLQVFSLLATAQVKHASFAPARDVVGLLVGVMRTARALHVAPSKAFLVAAVRRIGKETSGRDRNGSREVALSAWGIQRAIYAVLAARRVLLSSSSFQADIAGGTRDRIARDTDPCGLVHEPPQHSPGDNKDDGEIKLEGDAGSERNPNEFWNFCAPSLLPPHAVSAENEGSISQGTGDDSAVLLAPPGLRQRPALRFEIEDELDESSDPRYVNEEAVAVLVNLLHRLSNRLGDLSPVEALDLLQALEEHRQLCPPEMIDCETRSVSLSDESGAVSSSCLQGAGSSQSTEFLLLPDVEGIFFHIERYRHLLSSEQVTLFNKLLAAHLKRLRQALPERLLHTDGLPSTSSDPLPSFQF